MPCVKELKESIPYLATPLLFPAAETCIHSVLAKYSDCHLTVVQQEGVLTATVRQHCLVPLTQQAWVLTVKEQQIR